ncbi:MAG: rRNA pseudouridine synthase [Lachnospiraceae bacterium]|nr:rRNA pseudouridine synthase [Lachnospiraceae bacterium]
MLRLDKYLADGGAGSRSQVKEYIKKGKVSVNGIIVKNADASVGDDDVVECMGKRYSAGKFRYYMLNKPVDVVSATTDNRDRTVIDILKECDVNVKDLFPVGRLDKDTEGLLLITDDGQLSHELLSPKKHVDKTYEVGLRDLFTTEMERKLTEGVDIGEKRPTMPAKVQIINDKKILLTIREGKFHQVKRMLMAVGNEVIYLKRLKMGPLSLDDSLGQGEFRELSDCEINALKTIHEGK